MAKHQGQQKVRWVFDLYIHIYIYMSGFLRSAIENAVPLPKFVGHAHVSTEEISLSSRHVPYIQCSRAFSVN